MCTPGSFELNPAQIRCRTVYSAMQIPLDSWTSQAGMVTSKGTRDMVSSARPDWDASGIMGKSVMAFISCMATRLPLP
jgi:hypothetical protein